MVEFCNFFGVFKKLAVKYSDFHSVNCLDRLIFPIWQLFLPLLAFLQKPILGHFFQIEKIWFFVLQKIFDHNVHLLAKLDHEFESLYVSRIRVLVMTEICHSI